ncbi:Bcwrs1 [Botrytis cinerea B05.10]|uniref:Tryptophan--tRNA ligase, cytoplasmic n=3 Tax=Botryotinia fuckeliana TaxID=40559 RepID=A0A384JS97_BOTFB|nr:Bcwrs1 [Botrytis cinerea B05.10]ATZ53372.1 Bcwrs1 [Botrytis cinerea B05.10]EMR88741.1 putative tryptophanyl-trna synthetase protein [Botrytis cinerea BcDW1]CCD44452.1 similar to tryptophanyl-tRNA synthetase [Botrytis cinerea T4]
MTGAEPTLAASLATDAPTGKQTVDPYNVAGEIGADGIAKAINYLTLIDEFGTKKIEEADLKRFEEVTGHKPHRFMRRGIVFSHRDLHLMLDRHERGEPFFMYTGRGPSSDSMHIGHTVPFEFTKWLQDVFDVPLIIMLTDDEKYIFSEKRTIEEVQSYTTSNAKDIIAVGFDPKKTFIFSDYEYMGGPFYKNVTRISKHVTLNVARAVFGFNESSCIGKIHFGAVQGATSFANSFPHIFGTDESKTTQIPSLIPCAIDQDPYFRMTRDVAARLHYAKPALIHARFLDALQGPGSKMSASVDTSAIFMYDEPNKIKNKINKYAFSGGQVSEQEQREKGGDTEKDVSYQYLTFFLEDDEELESIRKAYRSGEMLTGELKARCIQELQKYVKSFQERRAKITDEVVADFFARKELVWGGNPNAKKVAPAAGEEAASGEGVEGSGDGTGKLTKNQEKKLAKMKAIEEKKKAAKAASGA